MRFFFIHAFLLLFLLATVDQASGRRRGRLVRRRLNEFICRRCFNRLYKHCTYAMGLTKRSVSESESLEEANGAMSFVASEHIRERRSANRKGRRRRASRRRLMRVHINCHVCRVKCFT